MTQAPQSYQEGGKRLREAAEAADLGDQPQHHRYSASGSEGWLTCAGKQAMEAGIPDTYSSYADEGSAAHYLAGECLKQGREPLTYLGKSIICWEQPGERDGQCFSDQSPPPEASERSRWRVNDEMVDNIKIFCDRIYELADGNQLFIEQRVHFGEAVGLEGAFGTADVIILTAEGDEFIVIDLKYGHLRVEAEKNSQMMTYALGVLSDFRMLLDPNKLQNVRLIIYQPRLEHYAEWVCPINDLIQFAATAREAIARSEEALLFVDTPNMLFDTLEEWQKEYLKPSEKGCQWCKAKASCPALARECLNAMVVPEATADDLSNLDLLMSGIDQDGLAKAMTMAIDKVPYLDFPTLVKVFGVIKQMQDWIEAVETRMLLELLQGKKHPLYKLVKGRSGNRTWTDADEVETLLRASRKLKIDQIYDRKLKSPTALEKELKDFPQYWAKVEKMIERSEGKIVVAPVADRRESLDPYGEALALLPEEGVTFDELEQNLAIMAEKEEALAVAEAIKAKKATETKTKSTDKPAKSRSKKVEKSLSPVAYIPLEEPVKTSAFDDLI